MGWTDDAEHDPPAGRRGPLPPEDRLWRHPSEIGRLGPTGAGGGTAGPPRAPLRAGRSRPSPSWAWVGVAFTLGALLTAGGLAAAGLLDEDDPQVTVERVEAGGGNDPGRAAEAVLAATVQLQAMGGPHGGRTGSGLLFRDDGHVLTSADLVEGAAELTATLPSGQRVPATIVGTDTVTDLAVVHVGRVDAPTAVLGSAADLQLGERVLGVGAADDPGRAAVAAERVVRATEVCLTTGRGTLYDLVVTSDDGATRPTPGSALVDQDGAVVGLVTGRTGRPDPDPGVKGVYATPIEYARRIADQLIDSGRARHAWLGTETGDGAEGTPVVHVQEASPAAAAGLRPGDVLTSIDGRTVRDAVDVALVLRDHLPGDRVRITFLRGADVDAVDVVLTEAPIPSA